MEKRLDGIESDIKTIKENHLHHMEIDIAHVKNDVSWLTKFFWVVCTASVGALITGIMTLYK